MSDLPDLGRHGILEAHAGTGKTHTIVRMVLELLVRERLELRQILLVTFTQKAAGELLDRIRTGIAKAREECGDPDLSAHLQRSLGQLGECWIGTIHGVALRILRAWPFESGLPFRTELVDDAEGLEDCLRAVWRRDPWGLDGPALASLAGTSTLGSLLDQALELAKGRLDPDMALLPDGAEDPAAWADLAATQARLEQDALRLEETLRHREELFLERFEPLAEEFLALPAAGLGKPAAASKAKVDGQWRRILSDRAAREESMVLGLAGRTRKTLADNLSERDRGRPEGARALELWTRVRELWETGPAGPARDRTAAHEALAGLLARRRRTLLAGWAALGAREWKSRKAAEGLLSYQDMLERLRDALAERTFRDVLRARIRVGVIDEFQDTSALQWDIFRTWFLTEGDGVAPRLFLVGDPKQSIYSFQGADVRTYLQACRDLEAAGARRFPLRNNWRSTPAVVQAVNRLLLGVPDWFGPGISYTEHEAVRTPVRTGDDEPAQELEPVVVVPLEGGAAVRRARYAERVAGHILSLVGATTRLPRGDRWTAHELDWGDFAVVVQTRTQVPSFRRAFRQAGIPWALYKEQGVFASRCAREFRTLLAALAEPPERQALKRRALLTRFFGCAPDTLDASPEPGSAGELLERFAALASQRRWARLFHALRRETGVEARLLEGEDGDRHWMDLRQTMEHALDFLLAGRGHLPELVEHLGRLERGEESVAEDRNLHARATDRQRVQILTMHVSKGLEFPVVFLATSPPRRAGAVERWIAEREGRLRLHMACRDHETAPTPAGEQALQEEARLLYVALTRPKLQVVVPLHRKSGSTPADLLSERLGMVALGSPIPPRAMPVPKAPPTPATDGETSFQPCVTVQRVVALGLRERERFLSSYSAVSRSTADHSLTGRLQRSEESDPPDAGGLAEASQPDPPADSWLPRGAATGDALHELLESCLRRTDLGWARDPAPPGWLLDQTRRTLRVHGLPETATTGVALLIGRILSSPLELPSGETVRLLDLPASDRRPEVEFHCALDSSGRILVGRDGGDPGPKGWLVGYIDLLLRHRGLWYVLDWKTTSLAGYALAELDRAMDEHDYRLQAALYAAVVERSGLGRCGGSAYVFVRAAAAELSPPDLSRPLPGVWTSGPSQGLDEFARARLERWMRSRRGPVSGECP
jgi:exodeoxyribonuclease V beta subunit